MLLDTMPNAELYLTHRPLGAVGAGRAIQPAVTAFLSEEPSVRTMTTSVFGNVHLGYIVVETQRFSDWRRFGATPSVCTSTTPRPTDAIPPRRQRVPLPAAARPRRGRRRAGLAPRRPRDLRRDRRPRPRPRGPRHAGSAEEATLRGVERFLRFPGPKGLTQEIYTTPVPHGAAAHAGSGFVTGAAGWPRRDHHQDRTDRGYYSHVFDARLTDYIDETISGLKLKIRFLRVNERHHSVAIASVTMLPLDPVRTRVQHVNIQAATLTT